MISEAQIRVRLFSYLIREISLNEFEDWVVRQSWNMHQDSDEGAQRLVGAIELRLAEYSQDHLGDDALERELKGLITPAAVLWMDDAKPIVPVWTGGTSSESLVVDFPVARAA